MAGQAVTSILVRIRVIRGQRVMLDSDLAALYGVATMRLNEQVKRNSTRFPDDFAFRIARKEWAELLSQNAITSRRRLDRLPLAFTEHGCLMLSNVLSTELATHRSKLGAHDTAILKLLADIRRLTGFPERTQREIGYTADWRTR